MGVARATPENLQVDVRIKHLIIVRAASSDLQYDCVSIGSILQVVTICITGLESCTVAYAERLFSGIRHENDLAFHYKDKFVLARMPMSLT